MKEDDELTVKEARQAFAGAQNDLCGGDDYAPPSLAEVGSATEQVWLPFYPSSSLSLKTPICNTWNYCFIFYSPLLMFLLPKSRTYLRSGCYTTNKNAIFVMILTGNEASYFLLVKGRKPHAIVKNHRTL